LVFLSIHWLIFLGSQLSGSPLGRIFIGWKNREKRFNYFFTYAEF
jgi:hypothetical protein